MRRLLTSTALLMFTALISFNIGCAKKQITENISLNISAAASLKDSINEIKKLYEAEKSDTNLTINFGSSGTLQQQIEQGADMDLFISAASKQMDSLESKNLILNETRKDLLLNNIVLIAPKDSYSINSFADLTTEKTKHIALGEPKSVPAGQYAEEILKSEGILDKVKEKTVYAKDVKEVLTWVETGNADAGIVYATDAKASDKVKVVAVVFSVSHNPIVYPAAVIKSSKNTAAAEDFMNFLSSEKAKAVFEKYGFRTNTK
jgi:molybdate transport system substrate-binding protein